jgi:hypothetical protein
MNKYFVTAEIARELKELGFNLPCFTSYDDENKLRNPFDFKKSEYDFENVRYIEDSKGWVYNSSLPDNYTYQKFESNFVAAPLYAQAFDWIRNTYNLYYSVVGCDSLKDYAYCIAKDSKLIFGYLSKSDDTYEEAELNCLKKMIEIIKENKNE